MLGNLLIIVPVMRRDVTNAPSGDSRIPALRERIKPLRQPARVEAGRMTAPVCVSPRRSPARD